MSPLITVAELAAALAADRPVRLLDVRWRLDEPEGRPAYVAGHLPGAVYVDLEHELARHGHPEAGSHPVPGTEQLTAAARRWGIRAGDLVVAYDDNDSVAASRAWWLLRRRGVDIRVLDGGLRAWVRAGLRLDASDHVVAPSDITLADADPGVIAIDEVATVPLFGTLIDVRAPEHYRGRAVTADPAAGHIPGAINIPAVSNIAPDGYFQPPGAIAQTLQRWGVRSEAPVVLYCGSGVASSHSALAYLLAGVETRVFTGSWSQWSRAKGRPVALGPTPRDHVRSA